MGEQAAALAYTGKWHTTYSAALHLLGGVGVVKLLSPSERMLGMIGTLPGALDLDNEEAAFAHGRPLDGVLDWLYQSPLPMRADGGTRRCIIRIYTWTPDDEASIGVDPSWITIGSGQSPNAAWAKAARWLRRQIESAAKGYVSRELITTAVEFVFWTSAYRTDYL